MNHLLFLIFSFLILLNPISALGNYTDEYLEDYVNRLAKSSPYYLSDQAKFNSVKNSIKSRINQYSTVQIDPYGTNYLMSLKYRNMTKVLNIAKEKNLYLEKKLEEKKCDPVDFRGEKLGEVRDQGLIGWCFAYAAADLLSFEIGKKVSARDIAQNYHLKNGFANAKEFIKGGYAAKAITTSLDVGVCSENNLPSNNAEEYKANWKSFQLREVFIELEKLKISYDDRASSSETKQKLPSIFHSFVDYIYEDSTTIARSPLCDSFYLIREIFPNTSLATIKEVLKTSSFDEYIKILFDAQCSKKEKPKKEFILNTEDFGRTDGIDKQLESLDHIDTILGSTNNLGKPVGISYDGKMMHYKNNVFSKTSHASTIVGRKKSSTGKCMYLIRNTWGRSYKRSDEDEAGHVWVSASEILANLGSYYNF